MFNSSKIRNPSCISDASFDSINHKSKHAGHIAWLDKSNERKEKEICFEEDNSLDSNEAEIKAILISVKAIVKNYKFSKLFILTDSMNAANLINKRSKSRKYVSLIKSITKIVNDLKQKKVFVEITWKSRNHELIKKLHERVSK